MLTAPPVPATPPLAPARPGLTPALRVALVAVGGLAVVLVALLLPAWPEGPDMGSTHYMGLLAANQPWNLLAFMAVPVIAAETVAITELVILVRRSSAGLAGTLNRWAGLIGGFYFLGVTAYLIQHAVVPLTVTGGWRGPADVIAVGSYLLGVVPLGGLALLETRVVGAAWSDARRLRVHAALVGVFLVVAHVAMIVGMLDPAVLGWSSHLMDDGSLMPGMTH